VEGNNQLIITYHFPINYFYFRKMISKNSCSSTLQQGHAISSIEELLETPFQGAINTLYWPRELVGNFSEIVEQTQVEGNITTLDLETLRELELSEQGRVARDILINDFETLKAFGAAPTINLITRYDRDDSYPFFPTDVYSFHVDRSPIPIATYLCTYYGDSSEILPNEQAEQKIRIPEIRNELKKLYDGAPEDFDAFLKEHFFDLHYRPKAQAQPIRCGLGHVWKIAVDHPTSNVPPCIHRAPEEHSGKTRLLLIC
jgi:hypothetical protein